MERTIDCSQIVRETMLPSIKMVLIWLSIVGIAGNLWQIFVIWRHADTLDLIGSSGSIIVYGAIISMAMTIPG